MQTGAEEIVAIIKQLHQAHPDSRELSLFASVELSLRRLTAEHKQWVQALAVFSGVFSIRCFADCFRT